MQNKNGDGAPLLFAIALEAKAGWTAETRLATSALSAIEGHVPFKRFEDAGESAEKRKVSLDSIDREMREWMQLSFHPMHHLLQGVADPFAVVAAHNAYNTRDVSLEFWDSGIASEFSLPGLQRPIPRKPGTWIFSSNPREFRLQAHPTRSNLRMEPCGTTALGSVQYLADEAVRRTSLITTRSLTSVSAELGAERSLTAEAALVFEREGSLEINSLAARLGCSKRTLERGLRKVGLTAGKLRLATMTIAAVNQIHTKASLTTIAADNEFADLAHMGRVIRASCGLTPSALRLSLSGLPSVHNAEHDFN